MDKILLSSDHYFLTCTKKVRKICDYLFSQLHFSFFDYARFYKPGNFYGLTVNDNSFKIFFELEYEPLQFCRNNYFENDRFYYFFSSAATLNPDKNYLNVLQQIYQITQSDHGLIILKKQADYVDIFFFSSPLPYHFAINNYLNELPLLIQFITYFQQESQELIYHAKDNEILLPAHMLPKVWTSPRKSSTQETELFPIKKRLTLTKRESECANYFCKGYTTKEIAILLNISPRTIETHLDNIKIKLNIKKKSDLIKLCNTDLLLNW